MMMTTRRLAFCLAALLLVALLLVAGALRAPPALAQGFGWSAQTLGRIDGLIDLRASPHSPSGLIALTRDGGWRALAFDGEALTDAGAAPFMGKLAPPEIIPHGRVGVAPGAPPAPDDPTAATTPNAAWFEGATRRYGHGVLGDAVEGSVLQVAFADRRILAHRLPESAVFEDLEPRILDADGDGTLEVLAIKAYLDRGATLALYAAPAGADRLVELAEAAPIGRQNRWLNPAGAADFDGDGRPEIAVVRTPHIGGLLIHYAWDGASARLVEERRVAGYSTHAIGSQALGLAAIHDMDADGRPDLVLPKQDRRMLAVVTVTDAGFAETARLMNPAPVAASLVVVDLDRDGDAEIVWGLEDGAIRALSRVD
ncbi:MAG: VCBS repeat-containing protein [Alphaproteobacteria bacterium]|nr:VCBS repeat-containing protein [Alphaproteobacteria bacterium]